MAKTKSAINKELALQREKALKRAKAKSKKLTGDLARAEALVASDGGAILNPTGAEKSAPTSTHRAGMKPRPTRYAPHSAELMEIAGSLNKRISAKVHNPVALSVALPGVYPPIRHPSAWNTNPSATASLHNVLPVDFTTLTSDMWPMVPQGQYIAAVSRDPWHAYMVPINFGASPSTATFVMVNRLFPIGTVLANPLGVDPSSASNIIHGQRRQELSLAVAVPLTSNPGQSQNLTYAFPIGGRQAYYLNSSYSGATSIYVKTLSGVMYNSANCELIVEKWDGKMWTSCGSAAFTGGDTAGAASVTLPITSGYHSFYWQDNQAAVPTTSVVLVTYITFTQAFCMFLPLPGLETQFTTAETMNVSGVSLMLSPNANDLNAAGEIVGYQMEQGEDFSNGFNFDVITNQPNYRMMPFKKGLYGFIKPNDEADFKLRPAVYYTQYQANTDGTARSPGWCPIPLDPSLNVWLLMAVKCPIVSGAVPSGTMYLTVNFNIIQTTTSQWIQQLRPTYGRDEYLRLLEALKDADQFYENPFHVRDLLGYFKSAGRTTLRIGGGLLKFIAPLVARFRPDLAPALLGAEMMVDGINKVVQ